MSIIIGISVGFHDAAICLLNGDEVIHASHSERYSRKKGDKWLHPQQKKFLSSNSEAVAFYEKPFRKNLRRLFAGQKWQSPTTSYTVSFPHHKSHAAAGYYTAPFDDCNILVIDAIGEWDTISIWNGSVRNNIEKVGKSYLGQKTYHLK